MKLAALCRQLPSMIFHPTPPTIPPKNIVATLATMSENDPDSRVTPTTISFDATQTAPPPRKHLIYGGMSALLQSARLLDETLNDSVTCVSPFSGRLTSGLQLSSDPNAFIKNKTASKTMEAFGKILEDSLDFQEKLSERVQEITGEPLLLSRQRIFHRLPPSSPFPFLDSPEPLSSSLSYRALHATTVFKERQALFCKTTAGGHLSPLAPLLLRMYLEEIYNDRFEFFPGSVSHLKIQVVPPTFQATIEQPFFVSQTDRFQSFLATTGQEPPLQIDEEGKTLSPLWEHHPILETYSLWTLQILKPELETRLKTPLETKEQIHKAFQQLLPWEAEAGIKGTPQEIHVSGDLVRITFHVSTHLSHKSQEQTEKSIRNYLDYAMIGSWSLVPDSFGWALFDASIPENLPEGIPLLWINGGSASASIAGARLIP